MRHSPEAILGGIEMIREQLANVISMAYGYPEYEDLLDAVDLELAILERTIKAPDEDVPLSEVDPELFEALEANGCFWVEDIDAELEAEFDE